MLLLSHKDCKTRWQNAGIKKADAPQAALELVVLWRFSAGPAKPNAAADGPRHPELDPAGWKAVWVEGGVETPVAIPPIPPAPAE